MKSNNRGTFSLRHRYALGFFLRCTLLLLGVFTFFWLPLLIWEMSEGAQILLATLASVLTAISFVCSGAFASVSLNYVVTHNPKIHFVKEGGYWSAVATKLPFFWCVDVDGISPNKNISLLKEQFENYVEMTKKAVEIDNQYEIVEYAPLRATQDIEHMISLLEQYELQGEFKNTHKATLELAKVHIKNLRNKQHE